MSNIEFYQTGLNLDYSVRGSQEKGSNALGVSFRVSDNSWKKIIISYLVTSRKDLHLGSFIVGNQPFI